jgi:anti-sigma factor RsiW
MHEWTDRLSAYRNDELPPGERAALESHLAACADCRAVLGGIEQVVLQAGSLPELQPPRDLWPAIAARMATPLGDAAASTVAAPRSAARESSRRRRVFRFTAPQLAAAAIALVIFSASAAWLAVGGGSGPAERAGQWAGTEAGSDVMPADAALLVAASFDERYALTVADLEGVLEVAREQLDPATVAVIEQSLAAIDSALDEARQALERDPGNAFLTRHMEATMRRRIDLLRSASLHIARS